MFYVSGNGNVTLIMAEILLVHLRLLTLKALKHGLTHSSGWAGRQLTPFHLLAAPPCGIGGAITDEVVPHGVTHSPVEAGVDLMRRKQHVFLMGLKTHHQLITDDTTNMAAWL